MAKINAFPLGTPKSNDLLVGTSIPIGQEPVAQWVINITYRLIQIG